MCSIFAHYWYYLYCGMLQTCEIYIIYALKHIFFGIIVKKYFVNLQYIANIGFGSAMLKHVWHCTRLAQ